MNFRFKKGFSLAELMVVLLLVSLLASALIPIVTKKHLTLPKRSEHGAYMCYYKDGKLFEKKTVNKYSGQSEEKQVENCVFTPPAKALYFQISAVGGGGGGGDSGYNGGNAHAVWDDLMTISPFGLTEAKINELHINYKGKGYFPPVASAGSSDDLSAQLYTYAKSYGSFKGGDIGYRSCSLVSGNPQYREANTSSHYWVADCPDDCPDDYADKGCTAYSGSGYYWDYYWYDPPGTTSSEKYMDRCATGTTTVPAQTITHTKDVYRTKYCPACFCGSSEVPCSYNVHQCPQGVTSKNKACGSEFDHTESWTETIPSHTETVYAPCEKTRYSTSASPRRQGGGNYYSGCICPSSVTTSVNAACEADRNALIASLSSMSTWGDYYTCYIAGDFHASFSDGMYTGSGGKAGSGVTCYETAGSGASKLVYNVSISSQVDASHNGNDGADNAPFPGNLNFHSSSFAAKDGQQQCLSDMANECGDGSDWSNVQYSEMELSDGSNSFKAKAYNAPKSGEGAKSKSISTGGINTTTNGTWNGATISDNTYSGSLCDGASSSDITNIKIFT